MHRETLCRRRRKHQDQNREEVSTTEHNDPHSPTEHQPICTVQPYCQVGLASSRSLGRDWRHRPGRPRACWTDQLRNDTGSVPANLWRQAILRGHGGATRQTELATR